MLLNVLKSEGGSSILKKKQGKKMLSHAHVLGYKTFLIRHQFLILETFGFEKIILKYP